jgi:hypothetical protein
MEVYKTLCMPIKPPGCLTLSLFYNSKYSENVPRMQWFELLAEP